MSATKEWLLQSAERDLDMLCAENDRLHVVNAEMLRALMRAENWLTELARVFPSEVPPDVLEQVRAAIASAKGRSE
jgi:hypothetical protein